MEKNEKKEKKLDRGKRKCCTNLHMQIYTVKINIYYYYIYYTIYIIYIDPIISDLILIYILLFFLMFIAR